MKMLGQNQFVETGVDKLLEIVSLRGKVCVTDLAKELGLSPDVVLERATHLEEVGLVGIEHSLFKTYITTKELTQKDIQKKGKEFSSKKEILIRQAGGALSTLSRVEEKVRLINDRYLKVKKEMEFDIDSLRKVSEEVDNLKEFKADLGQEIKNLSNHLKELKSAESKIKSDLKSDYRKVKGLLNLARQKYKGISKLQKKTKALTKFSQFINKNMKVFSSMEKLDVENKRLRIELAELIKKAKSVNIAAKGAGFVKEINNLENRFMSLDKKRQRIVNNFIRYSGREVEMATEDV